MARKRFTAESIIIKLREAEVGLAQGQTVGQMCRQIGVSESPNVGPGECWDRLDRPSEGTGIFPMMRPDWWLRW